MLVNRSISCACANDPKECYTTVDRLGSDECLMLLCNQSQSI